MSLIPTTGVLVPKPASGSAPSLVQTASNQVANTTSVSYTFSAAPTSGNTIYAFVTGRDAAPSTTPPTGWTYVNSINPNTGTSLGVTVIFSKVSDGSETTVSFSIPGTPTYLSVTACEIHGTSAINAQVWNTIGNTYTAPPYDFGPCTPTANNCLAIGFSDVRSPGGNAWTSVTATSGWTIASSLLKLYCSQALCWQNCGASGAAMDGSFTFSGGSTSAKYIVAGMLILQ